MSDKDKAAEYERLAELPRLRASVKEWCDWADACWHHFKRGDGSDRSNASDENLRRFLAMKMGIE